MDELLLFYNEVRKDPLVKEQKTEYVIRDLSNSIKLYTSYLDDALKNSLDKISTKDIKEVSYEVGTKYYGLPAFKRVLYSVTKPLDDKIKKIKDKKEFSLDNLLDPYLKEGNIEEIFRDYFKRSIILLYYANKAEIVDKYLFHNMDFIKKIDTFKISKLLMAQSRLNSERCRYLFNTKLHNLSSVEIKFDKSKIIYNIILR